MLRCDRLHQDLLSSSFCHDSLLCELCWHRLMETHARGDCDCWHLLRMLLQHNLLYISTLREELSVLNSSLPSLLHKLLLLLHLNLCDLLLNLLLLLLLLDCILHRLKEENVKTLIATELLSESHLL